MARTKATVRQFRQGGIDRIKKHRWKPGTVAKREIRRYQTGKKATATLVPKAAMSRLIREITQEYGDLRFKTEAIEALQQASEDYIVDLFKRSNRIRSHCKRETLGVSDIKIAQSVMSDEQ